MIIYRLINANLIKLFILKNTLIVFWVFSIYFILFTSTYGISQSSSLLETIILIYYGPFDNSLELFRWLLFQVPLFLIIGNFVDQELKVRALYILPRIGKFSIWITGITISAFIYIVLYYLFGFILTMLLLNFFGGYFESSYSINNLQLLNLYNPKTLVLHLYFLLLLSTYAMVLLNILFSIILKNSIYSFVIVIVIIVTTIISGDFFVKFIQWFPPSHGMFVKIEIMNLSFTRSYLFLIIIIILLCFFLPFLFKKTLLNLLYENDN